MADEVIFLIVGAGIALVSSIITTLLASFLEYRRSKKTRVEEKEERAYQLMGRLSGVHNTGLDDQFTSLEDKARILDELVQVRNHDGKLLSGLIGLLDVIVEEGENSKTDLQNIREENAVLESKLKQLEAEHKQLEAKRVGLENKLN